MSDSRNVLVLCTTHRDRRELEKIARQRPLRFHFHDYASLELENLAAARPEDHPIADPRQEIRNILDQFGGSKLHGVISTDDYPGSVMAAIVAKHLGLPGISALASLRCQHKYLSRLDQQRWIPEAVPKFSLLDSNGSHARGLDYPIFVKPVKSFFSIGARRVDSAANLEGAVREATLPAAFYRPFNQLLRMHPQLELAEISDHCVIAEALLRGHQCTLEGYVRRGVAHTVGIVDSIFYPGTRSFERFEYPSTLPPDTVAHLERVSARLMEGIHYGEGFFNIEFMVDPEDQRARIIEVNPRLASQFADLYEKVDGTNSYQMLVDLALGTPPARMKGAGRHRVGASCVLRRFDDAFVRELPSERSVERLQSQFPDARIEVLAERRQWLSRSMQDGHSFRYGIVNIGASNRGEILKILTRCIDELEFDFDEAEAFCTHALGKPRR